MFVDAATLIEELPILLSCLAAGFLSYNGSKYLRSWWSKKQPDEYVPIGVVKYLHIFPLKSAKGHRVFSFYCNYRGPTMGETKDREFQLINGNTGDFYSCKIMPQLVLAEANVENEILHINIPGKKEILVNKEEVKAKNDVRPTIWNGLRIDGYDCGEEVSKAFSEFLEEDNVRLTMIDDSLYNERICTSTAAFWRNNEVPDRRDRVNFHNFAPFLIQTEGSLTDLNSRIPEPVEQMQLRPVIVIDKCPAWDEDRWSELRIGEVELQCYRPCGRCPLITVSPTEGKKNTELQPLRALREYRMAPKGPMLDFFKEKPIFGVCAGIYNDKTGYIHEGQVVYGRYKPCAF